MHDFSAKAARCFIQFPHLTHFNSIVYVTVNALTLLRKRRPMRVSRPDEDLLKHPEQHESRLLPAGHVERSEFP